MAAVPRPWDFGIIYAASGDTPLPTYVDIKSVTQSYITLNNVAYTEMTTVTSGGVDTSKPYADGTSALTLSLELGFSGTTEYKVKLQYRRWDESADPNAWKDLQTVNQDDSSVTSAEQTITGAAEVKRLALQTASVFTAGQIRVVAYSTAGDVGAGNYILIRGMVG